jgi:hypothetical protein
VEINTSLPLAPIFNIPRPSVKPRLVKFKYERLDDYCTLCGLIGHKKNACPTPQILIAPKTSTYISPRMVTPVRQEDSDSGISLAASVGNSPSNIEPTQLKISPRQKKISNCSSRGCLLNTSTFPQVPLHYTVPRCSHVKK